MPDSASGLLVADLGGTNCRLGLVRYLGGPVEDVRSVANDTAPGLVPLVAAYLGGRPVDRMVLAIAAPVNGARIPLTNRDWVIDRAEIRAAFGLSGLEIVNDFQALGHALDKPAALETVPVKPGEARAAGARIILGAGTGFNCSARLADGAVVVCEAGHTSFAPLTDLDRRLQDAMTRRYGRCSNERLLSGTGLRAIHVLISGTETADGAGIIRRGLSGQDAAASETCTAFARILGQAAGDLALLFQATGGVWLSGGPTRALRPLLEDSSGPFQAAFTAKGRMQDVMEQVPVHLVTSDQAAVAGCISIANRVFPHD